MPIVCIRSAQWFQSVCLEKALKAVLSHGREPNRKWSKTQSCVGLVSEREERNGQDYEFTRPPFITNDVYYYYFLFLLFLDRGCLENRIVYALRLSEWSKHGCCPRYFGQLACLLLVMLASGSRFTWYRRVGMLLVIYFQTSWLFRTWKRWNVKDLPLSRDRTEIGHFFFVWLIRLRYTRRLCHLAAFTI